MAEQKRQSNFELLRIVAMCMIIAMHYITKGMQIEKLSVDNSAGNLFFWFVYAFCTVSVNAYVLISGYFMVDSEWRIGKVIRLWLQVLCYSILVPLIMGALGFVDLATLDFGTLQQIFMPISYEHYWFATAYVMMYLLSPVLAMAVKNMSRVQLRNVILVLLVVFCGFKSINPYLIPWDKYGCDFAWFVCLFLIAGYIRMYGIEFFCSRGRAVIVYISFSLLTFMIALVASFVVRATGKFEYYMDMTYCYNYITVLIASIALFYIFIHSSVGKKDGADCKVCNIINRLAGYTFGVYLLHENILIREKWQQFPGMAEASGKWWQIFHMLICIVVIMIAGIIVDYFRTGLLRLVENRKK